MKIKESICKYDLYEIGVLANSLQKCGIYNEVILELILKKTTDFLKENALEKFMIQNSYFEKKTSLLRELKEIEKCSLEYKAKLIEFNNLQIDEIRFKKSMEMKRFSLENFFSEYFTLKSLKDL